MPICPFPFQPPSRPFGMGGGPQAPPFGGTLAWPPVPLYHRRLLFNGILAFSSLEGAKPRERDLTPSFERL